MENSEKDIRTIFKENLNRYLVESGVSQRDLATYMGVAASTMNEWVKGRKIPRMNKIDKLCEFFHVTRTDLLDAHDNSHKAVKIPVVGRVVAGIPIEAITDVQGYEEIPSDMADTGRFFALRVKGDSMAPRISSGDVVIVRKQSDVESGDVAIVLVNGNEATIKQVKKGKDGIMLIGYNVAVYQPHFYSNKDIQTLPVSIIGKVVELRAKF